MLKRLHLRNFTVFADAEFEFGDGLNVLVGTNGTGKTHVLKAGYVTLSSLHNAINRNAFDEQERGKYIREKLIDVFQPNGGDEELISRGGEKEASIELLAIYPHGQFGYSVTFSATKSHAVYAPPTTGNYSINYADTVFIPAKEVLTMS